MDDIWEIDWKPSGWTVTLIRYKRPTGYIAIGLKNREPNFGCRIFGTDIATRELMWPWHITPIDPAAVCEMCRRLLDDFMAKAKPSPSK